MSKSKKHKNRLSSFFGITAALLLAGAAVFAGLHMERNTEITLLNFTGNTFTDENLLTDAIESPIGMLADSVRFDEIFEQLKTLPYVSDVGVKMDMRGTLTFHINEYQPIGMLVEGPNRAYIAEGGIRLPVIPEKIHDVPLIYGFAARPLADTLKNDAYQQVEQFLTAARANNLGWITISEVAWNNHEGVVALSYENGVKLIFGMDDFNQKIEHWEAFYSNVVARKGIHSFHSIDLRFRDQIVTQNL